jgi:hypothetical protein
MPLVREMPPPTEFPTDVLGRLLGNAARGICDIVRVPEAMAAQSVLGAAALAVQAHADITLPTEQTRPCSLFLLTVAGTGDRKTAADHEALWPIRQHERNLRSAHQKQLPAWQDRYDLWKAAREKILKGKATHLQKQADLAALGPQPVRPLEPTVICEEPTIEGLIKELARGQPAMGLFSAEGGQFVGGHGMGPDHRLKTATAFSQLWDGETIKRIRAGEDTLVLPGRRVSLHLMAQPEVAALLLTDHLLAAQGLLSRILLAAPDSLIGTRFWRDPAPQSDVAIKAYGAQLLLLLENPPIMTSGTINELEPRALRLSPAARAQWIAFADDVERQMAGGAYEQIRGFASKAAEHAARIATVLAVVEQPEIDEMSAACLEGGVALARYYANESLRLLGVADVSPDLKLAGRVLEWLKGRQGAVSLRDVYTYGPRPIRSVKPAAQIMALLEEHGHIRPAGGTAKNPIWEVVS